MNLPAKRKVTRMIRYLLPTLALLNIIFLYGNPLLADDETSTSKGIVRERLLRTITSNDITNKTIAAMSSDDLSYFASNLDRLQVAGNDDDIVTNATNSVEDTLLIVGGIVVMGTMMLIMANGNTMRR